MTSLRDLLVIQPSDVSGILEEFSPHSCPPTSNIQLTFHYIRFQNDLARIGHFVSKLCDVIPAFCLDRDKVKNVSPLAIRRAWKEAKDKLAQPSNYRTGEPGELIIYFLLEGYRSVPKIFSKMSMKTNPGMHVHGSDGVHLGLDGEYLVLYFGEAKLHSSHTKGVSSALKSVKEFVDLSASNSNRSLEDFEINILSRHIDLPDGPLKERVINALDPYHEERDKLTYKYTCFIGFDVDEINRKCDKANFLAVLQRRAESCYQAVLDKINSDPILSALSWEFFFIPFGSVDDFREAFLREVNA